MRAALLAILVSVAACHAPAHPPDPADDRLTGLLEARCAACHETDLIYSSGGTAAEWHELVHRMVYHHKAKLLTRVTDVEAMEIAEGLARTQPPMEARVHIGFRPTGREP